MERYLSIVLDHNCNISKTLVKKEKNSLDSFILNNFNNSMEIRDFYKEDIEKFLSEHKNIIYNISEKTGKKYRGQIVILELLDDLSLRRVKVLYKSDLKNVREILKDQYFMRNFVLSNYSFFSSYVYNKIKYNLSKTEFQYMINEWLKNFKNNDQYFDVCRLILKKYAEFNKKTFNNKNSVLNVVESKTVDLTDINNEYDPDIDYHPDLDDEIKLKKIEEQELEDNLIKENCNIKKLVKKKENNNFGEFEQLTFFD